MGFTRNNTGGLAALYAQQRAEELRKIELQRRRQLGAQTKQLQAMGQLAGTFPSALPAFVKETMKHFEAMPPKPKTFKEKLQLEIDDWLKDVKIRR